MRHKMKMYSSSSLMVDFDLEQERLYLECLGKLQSEEFRENLLKALQYAEKYQVKQWLLDLREIDYLVEEEEIWLLSHLFPRIMMTMGIGNYVALLLPEKCYEILLNEAGKLGLMSYNSFIIINTFSKMQEALEWLDQNTVSNAG